jgi:hypothetical protein
MTSTAPFEHRLGSQPAFPGRKGPARTGRVGCLPRPRRSGKPPFRHNDEGTLATIGRHAAIADFGRVKLTGWVGWVLWGIVHIFFLIGFRNRAAVFLNWAWAWITYGSGARLITGEMTTLAPGADSMESKRPGATSPCGTNLELPRKPREGNSSSLGSAYLNAAMTCGRRLIRLRDRPSFQHPGDHWSRGKARSPTSTSTVPSPATGSWCANKSTFWRSHFSLKK